jgi:hypothetical protein
MTSQEDLSERFNLNATQASPQANSAGTNSDCIRELVESANTKG